MTKRGFVVSFVGLLSFALGGRLWAGSALLKPDEAFKFSIVRSDGQWIEIEYVVAEGYQLYADKFSFKTDGLHAGIEQVIYPQAQERFDQALGEVVRYFTGRVRIAIRLNGRREAVRVTAGAQGCAPSLGICYPPMSRVFVVPALESYR